MCSYDDIQDHKYSPLSEGGNFVDRYTSVSQEKYTPISYRSL